MYDMIYEIVKLDNLLEVNTFLKLFDDALTKKIVDRTMFCKELSKALYNWAYTRRIDTLNMKEKPKYYICEQQYSIPDYLISFGLALGKVREVRNNIKKIIIDIENNIIKPSGNYLSMDIEKTIIELIK
jgi:hypothetical protein